MYRLILRHMLTELVSQFLKQMSARNSRHNTAILRIDLQHVLHDHNHHRLNLPQNKYNKK